MAEELSEIEEMLKWRVDGIILCPRPAAKNRDKYAALAERNYPLVFVNEHAPEFGVPNYVCDDYLGGGIACAHLIELGHRKIGLINTGLTSITFRMRCSGVRSMLREHHLKAISGIKDQSASASEQSYIFDTATAMLLSDNPPTAFCCMNDGMALEVIRAVETLGLRIPQDVSTVGFSDDIRYAEWLRIPLTTVRADHFRLGFEAANALFDYPRINDSQRIHQLPPELVIRASTGPPSTQK